jgi:hypothetical protein
MHSRRAVRPSAPSAYTYREAGDIGFARLARFDFPDAA